MPIPISDTDYLDSRRKYPNPFFDLAREYIPKNIKTLFAHCRTYFYTNGFIHSVIMKLTEYPITDILFEETLDKDTKEQYNEYFNRFLKLKKFLIEIGIDYFIYGNCFISDNTSFDRYLECSNCSKKTKIDNTKYRWKNYRFLGKCPECKTETVFEIFDQIRRGPSALKFVRWAPQNIDISYDPYTGEGDYYYSIGSILKKKIENGNKEALRRTPELFITAIKNKKSVLLDPNNLYHLKAPVPAEENSEWGKPIILPALKDIYYMQVLKRGNEAIAQEHIIPKKYLYPQPIGDIAPHTIHNLATWKAHITSQVERWRRDPNNTGVFPFPIGDGRLGGDAKILLLTAELRFLEETIINSLGVPVEFIKGGISWSGSSISLRIVENHFLSYREHLMDLLNYFILPKITSVLGYRRIKVKFKRFRMSDDSEYKNMIVLLYQSNVISDHTLLEELGYVPEEEHEAIRQTEKFRTEQEIGKQKAIAKAQGESQVILAKYQTRAQMAAQDEIFAIKTEKLKEKIAIENPGGEKDVVEIIDDLATEIGVLPDKMKILALQKLQKTKPITFGLILQKIQSEAMATGPQSQSQNNVAQQQQPKPKPSEPEKHGPPTRGNI